MFTIKKLMISSVDIIMISIFFVLNIIFFNFISA